MYNHAVSHISFYPATGAGNRFQVFDPNKPSSLCINETFWKINSRFEKRFSEHHPLHRKRKEKSTALKHQEARVSLVSTMLATSSLTHDLESFLVLDYAEC
jgi:hypothetical protein